MRSFLKKLEGTKRSPLCLYHLMQLEDDIRRLTEEILTGGQFLVDVNVSSRKGPGKISVVIDGDEGVGIDDCAAVSRHLSDKLDGMDLPDARYVLEVTTPGIDQPLRMQRQYRKNIGRKVKVHLRDRIVEGVLADADETTVTLAVVTGKGKNKETASETVAFADIDKTFVMISFK